MAEVRVRHLRVSNLCAGYSAKQDYISKNINFEVSAGEIMAIMGPSGAGKSTLIKALMGQIDNRQGSIHVNGEDVTRTGLACVSARVAWVPQQDILIDELTVWENIRHFHTVAIDSDISAKDLDWKIRDQLGELGIAKVADKRVGLYGGGKNISGGQLKRANIAMELVNDPDILIIDEPTSGLSSQDSLELIKSLRRIADSGKIVIVIIHQPNSDIFRMFDRLLVLDGKGFCIRSGTRNEVMSWFRDNGLFEGESFCDQCGNSYPEKLLAAVESYDDWSQASRIFSDEFSEVPLASKSVVPKNRLLRSPFESIKDFKALVACQLRIRMRDRMSQIVTVLAPILLGLIMAAVFKATPEGGKYAFESNKLYPQGLFMLIIGAMFLSLVSSVFEIIKDRAMLGREIIRGLSTTAYYISELTAQAFFCLIQSFLLVLAANFVFDAGSLLWPNFFVIYAMMLLTSALGLLVSMLFNSPIAAYNMIPILLIPQIILGGALLSYKEMGSEIYLWEKKDANKQPLPARIMPASWAYEWVMRLNYEKMHEGKAPKNQSVLALANLNAGTFLSPHPDRRIHKDWRSRLPGKEYHEKALSEDVWTLFVIFILLAGTGIIWIRSEYRNTRWHLWIMQCVLLVLFAYLHNSGLEEVPISIQSSPVNSTENKEAVEPAKTSAQTGKVSNKATQQRSAGKKKKKPSP